MTIARITLPVIQGTEMVKRSKGLFTFVGANVIALAAIAVALPRGLLNKLVE